ncbi:hypothetical protein [Polaribacter ponticola]|uniref:Transporter n=1 Tax=Polaribacter ponticola TaxID=2978475 RepID=A0ABT5SBQ4_9FLAO|nr:hypothetical protein [Polaribacter sp. MSW5]MDD7915546.1 hypothetical protein [Polaribacter sp. MSW5]
MKNSIKIIILFISLSAFSQSPWTQEKGKFYTQLSLTTIPNYDTLFGDPEYNTERETTDNTIQFYGEYGITNNTSLLVNLPFKLIKTGDFVNPNLSQVFKTTEASKSAFGNIEIGLKHNFYKKDWILSGQFSVEANTSTYNEASGIRTGYDAWSFTPLFLAGKSFGKSYLQTFIGANIRTNNYSSNFKIGGEYGKKLGEKFWLIGFLDITKSLENGDIILTNANLTTGLYVNDQEYGGFGFKGIYEINSKFGVNAGLGGAFFGNNVAKQGAFTFGVYHKF